MINIALDRRVEDKYVYKPQQFLSLTGQQTPTYTDVHQTWDALNNMALFEICPVVTQGPDVGQRNGLKAFFKYCRLELRFRPEIRCYDHEITENQDADGAMLTQNPRPNYPPMRGYIIETDATTADTDEADILGHLAAKYKEPGRWRQDFMEDDEKKGKFRYKCIDKFMIPVKYQHTKELMIPYETMHATQNATIVRYQSHGLRTTVNRLIPIKRKLEFDDNSEFMSRRYFVFIDARNHRLSSDPWFTPMPTPEIPARHEDGLSYRAMWVYEDA